MPDGRAEVSRAVDRRVALAREWDALVRQVRELDGFGDFLRPPQPSSLLPAAAHGPVVMVNLSQWRCDALIVTADGVRAVPLPGVTLTAVAERTGGYLRVLRAVDQAVHDLYAARERYDDGDHTPEAIRRYTGAKLALNRAAETREATLTELLAWLWDEIAAPVLADLRLTAPVAEGAPWPRLWWCPTGLLTLLPMHAAGHHDGTGRAVIDRAISSYTPSLRALRAARRPLDPNPGDERMLVVALERTTGTTPLTDVARERDLLTSLFSSRATLLEGEAATTGAVRAELPRHRWAHFCCHGGQDLAAPSQGGLLLHDRVLTIADISADLSAEPYRGEFAFLSACMTATGGVDLPDEAITLAAALHHTGYRQVIGTLWSVYDDLAADVAEAVYADLTASGRFEPGRAAHALHRAVHGLRDARGLPPSAWTPFVHLGP
ncbi:CHAT domain-containing protein [Nonomuraea sp. NPDC047529]|uniref:CHAT domain-containing protein n=1 Tax=Nonomuraea sp. NPDC047529 TaxID=3155623 RepID=UPI0033ECCAB3